LNRFLIAASEHMKLVIFTADDLGICEATNQAINRAFCEGVLTSASLMASGPAFEHAVEEVVAPNPRLGVGLHLCLTSGHSVTAPERIPLLVDHRGRFRHGFSSLCRLLISGRAAALTQIERELSAQFQHLAIAGVIADHVDSHRHFHMIPPIFELVTKLTRQHGCAAVRISHEPLRAPLYLLRPGRLASTMQNLPKKVVLSILARQNRRHVHGFSVPRSVFGILDSGDMNVAALTRSISNAPEGLIEIITHPGTANAIPDADLDRSDRRFLRSPNREQELQALMNPKLRDWIEHNQISLMRYAELVKYFKMAPSAHIGRNHPE